MPHLDYNRIHADYVHELEIPARRNVRSTLHLAELFKLADKAGLLRDPERAASRMKAVLAVRGLA